ncbi:MAG: MTH938/NDUFAF3 family protein [Proteobacteria bacterium]|nr:MTH938/NDUFAF3 family protein [Pseudomonadota bacterium]
MDLSENQKHGKNYIKQVSNSFCQLAGKEFKTSIVIEHTGIIKPIQISHIDQLTESLLEKMINSMPEVLIIGSGKQVIFPDTKILHPLVKNHIGLEIMTNQAAARTFNVLLDESRKVMCLMILN